METHSNLTKIGWVFYKKKQVPYSYLLQKKQPKHNIVIFIYYPMALASERQTMKENTKNKIYEIQIIAMFIGTIVLMIWTLFNGYPF